MSINFDLWKLLAGLGIFLFGMQLIEESQFEPPGLQYRHRCSCFFRAAAIGMDRIFCGGSPIRQPDGAGPVSHAFQYPWRRAFFPFLGPLSRLLTKVFPDYKTILTVYLDQTPKEITDAATAALRKEAGHLLQECQLYNLRLLRIDERLVFDVDLPFEANRKKRYTLDEFYENIKLLHAEIFTFYSKIQTQKLDETEVKELERLIYASRNMMNSIKNFKGIRHNLDEFDGSDNAYLNVQYKLFRKRLVELYHNMGRILNTEHQESQYRSLLTSFVQIEEADNRFIKNTLNAVAEKKIQEMEIASLLLVNRLFTQSCRMQIYSMKDLLLSQEQINNFDRAMDAKEIMDAEKERVKE
jgi:phosphate:Na+ symporter